MFTKKIKALIITRLLFINYCLLNAAHEIMENKV